MGIKEEEIKSLDAKVYDDKELLRMRGMLNANALSEEEKRNIFIENELIKKRLEHNKFLLKKL